MKHLSDCPISQPFERNGGKGLHFPEAFNALTMAEFTG
jgi:hypothetical protein